MIRFVLFCLAISFGVVTVDNPFEWQLKKYENDIAIYAREVQGSGFKELKAVTSFHSNLSGLVAIVKDIPATPDYVHHCKQAYIVSSRGDSEITFYQETYVPWPMSNRDVVILYKIKQDKRSKTVIIEAMGIQGIKPLVEGNVRIPELRGYWKFSLKKDGSVSGEYCLYLDPGSPIPDWLTNMFLIDGPFYTISKMKTLVTEKKYQDAKFQNIVN
ncbi:MAG: hypothetical protein ACHQK8_00035 [Bacteroidia bacterium]